MRRIKFKVFNHNIKAMYNVYGFSSRRMQWAKEDGSLGGSFSYGQKNKKSFTVLQWTGFVDNNLQEIYDKDVVLYNGVVCLVEWCQQAGAWWLKWTDGDNIKRYKEMNATFSDGEIYQINSVAVIGNIYENPNLLI